MIRDFALLILAFLSTSAIAVSQSDRAAALDASAIAGSFVSNRGQVADDSARPRPDVLYTTGSSGATVFIAATTISYVFDRREAIGCTDGHGERCPYETTDEVTARHRMDVELVGANRRPQIIEEERAAGVRNFYLAHCPDGVLRVPAFRRLVFREVYPRIDMVMRTVPTGMKVEFVVRPGGNVDDIRLRYAGATGLRLDDDGSITATTPLGTLVESAPRSFQSIGAGERLVPSRFRVHGDVVTFEVDEFDRARPLVIDPVRVWATYYGGSPAHELLNGGDVTEVDRAGNVFVAGYVNHTSFPVTTGAHQTTHGGHNDGFVVKLDGEGGLQWATLYGGSGAELAHGLAADTALNIFVAGHTESANFPVSASPAQSTYGGSRDAFVVKLDPDGARVWATYFGGDDFDDGYGFAADSAGNVAVLVTTKSMGLETTGMNPREDQNSYDALIVKLSATGSLMWASHFGGSSLEFGYAIATDTSEAIIITGWTASNDISIRSAAQSAYGGGVTDAFVAKFDLYGNLIWSTYCGGTGEENSLNIGVVRVSTGFVGIATDRAGNVIVGGTTSGGFPTTLGAMQWGFAGGLSDAFVIKYDAAGARQWATYHGGTGTDGGAGVAANPDGAVLLTGFTTSTNLPVTTNCATCTAQGLSDAFLLRMSDAGAREYADYYGGTGNDEAQGISFDPHGSIVIAGHTWSTDFPVQNPAQSTKGGSVSTNADAFVVLYCEPSKVPVDTGASLAFCPGDSIVLQALDGFVEYRWNGDPALSSRRLVVRAPGTYWLRARSVSGCVSYSDTFTVREHRKVRPRITPAGPLHLCTPDTILLDAGTGYVDYRWMPGGERLRTLLVTRSGTYRVVTVDIHGCRDTSAPVDVTSSPLPVTPTISPDGPHVICDGDSLVLTAAGSPADRFEWNTGAVGRTFRPTVSGRYRVTVRTPQGCIGVSQDVDVTVNPKPDVTIFPIGPTTFCEGDSVVLSSARGFTRHAWSTGERTPNIVARRSGTYRLTVTDSNGCTGQTSVDVTVESIATPKLAVTGPTSFCDGDRTTLAAPDGYASYRWNTGAVARSIVVTKSGRYWVTVGSGAGCTASSDSVDVVVIPRPAIGLTGPIGVCPNASATYEVLGEPDRTYEWTVTGTGASVISGDGTSRIVVRWGASGSGSVKVAIVATTSGCRADSSITITVGTSLVPSVSVSNETLCPGDSALLDAGAGYASYRWSTGETTRSIVVRSDQIVTVEVRDADGCGGSSLPIVIRTAEAPVPTVVASRAPRLCPLDTLTLSVEDFDDVIWSTGDRGASITVRTPGTYWVVATDSNGCTGRSADFAVLPSPSLSPIVVGPSSVCPGATARFCVDATGGVFDWTVTGGTIVSGQGTECIVIAWPSAPGIGTVVVRAGATDDHCAGTSAIHSVSIASELNAAISADGPVRVCAGDSVTLDAGEFARYLWSNGATTRRVRVPAGDYSVEVEGDGGCSGSGRISITERPAPLVAIAHDGVPDRCVGDSIVLRATPGLAEYRWSDGRIGPSIVVTTTGTFDVTALDSFGCSGVAETIEVRFHPAPPTPVVTRDGDELVSSPSDSYQWMRDGTPIPGATSRRYRPQTDGTYTVRIATTFGCSAESAPPAAVAASASVIVASVEARPGERVSVPIILESSANLDAVGATVYAGHLRFNRSLLFPAGSTALGVVDGDERVVPFHGSVVSSARPTTLVTLEFVAALGDADSTTLVIEDFAWLEGLGPSVATSTLDGTFRIVSQGGWRLYLPGGRLALAPPQPNPAGDRLIVTFETIEPGRTTISLFDAIGRSAPVLFDEHLEPGARSLDVDVAHLAPGAYFLMLSTPTGRVVQPMQIVR